MYEIFINSFEDIIEAKYGKDAKMMDVTKILQNLVKSNSLVFEISNKLFGSDPFENVVKELHVTTKNNNHIIEELNIIKFIIDKKINDQEIEEIYNKINYYIVITNKEHEDMIDFYFIFMKYIIKKTGHNFIKVLNTELKDKIITTKRNVLILYKTIFDKKDMIFIKNHSIKIYFLNVEQLSLLISNIDDDCKHKNNIQTYLLKTIKFISENNLSLIDYSYENKKIWSINYDIKNVIVLEPCLNDNMVNVLEKKIDFISLFNHIEYRHNFKNKYLNDIDIKSFSGYFCNKRRNLFAQSKILINLHAGKSYQICELFRIYEAIAHKVLIVSQESYDINLISLKNYIQFISDEDMNLKIKKISNNYNSIYKKIYSKSVNEIFKNIHLRYEDFFTNITEHFIN